jgi:hypothetical protein
MVIFQRRKRIAQSIASSRIFFNKPAGYPLYDRRSKTQNCRPLLGVVLAGNPLLIDKCARRVMKLRSI